MTDYKKKYEKYKDKYRRLKKRLQNDRNNMFQPIRPQPILYPFGSTPVLLNSLSNPSIDLVRPPVLVRQPFPVLARPPSPILVRPPFPILVREPSPVLVRAPSPLLPEKKQYFLFATLSDVYKSKFSETIKLLKKIYFPDFFIKEDIYEPHILLTKELRITDNDVNEINQILREFISFNDPTIHPVKFTNIGFHDNFEKIVIYASIESSKLSEIYNYLKENIINIKLFNEENKLNIPLLYLKSNIENKSKIISDVMEDAKNMLKRNGINEGDYISFKSINLTTPM
jgi:hypothetical protein